MKRLTCCVVLVLAWAVALSACRPPNGGEAPGSWQRPTQLLPVEGAPFEPSPPAVRVAKVEAPLTLTLVPAASSTPEVSPSFEGVFAPAGGKILLIIGQDSGSIDAYVQSVGMIPAGVTSYTNLASLKGIHEPITVTNASFHLDYLAETYPAAYLAVGLSLKPELDSILFGEQDTKIDRLLDDLSGYQRPVLLRFGYEFDGPWNAYEPEQFKGAWIRFHQRMQAKGVLNVAMVWQSAAHCGTRYLGRPLADWYPGDEFVDWAALSYFTPADCQYRSANELLAFARLHHKPVMIAEATPQRYQIGQLNYSPDGQVFQPRTADQIWSEWFGPFFDFVYKNADVIKVVAYINTYWDEQVMWGPPYANGYWGDSRVQANPDMLVKWKAEIVKDPWLSP